MSQRCASTATLPHVHCDNKPERASPDILVSASLSPLPLSPPVEYVAHFRVRPPHAHPSQRANDVAPVLPCGPMPNSRCTIWFPWRMASSNAATRACSVLCLVVAVCCCVFHCFRIVLCVVARSPSKHNVVLGKPSRISKSASQYNILRSKGFSCH